MKNLILALTAIGLLICPAATDAQTFDNDRRGLVLGGGLGFSAVARWDGRELAERPVVSVDEENNTGFAGHVILGYGVSERDILGLEFNTATAQSTEFEGDRIWQGIIGAAWYHYFAPVGDAVFVHAALGVMWWQQNFLPDADLGPAIQFGFGYEFRPHFQIGMYLANGRNEIEDQKFNLLNLNFLVTAVAF